MFVWQNYNYKYISETFAPQSLPNNFTLMTTLEWN